MADPRWRALLAALLCLFGASVCAGKSAGFKMASLAGLPLTLDQPFVYENGEKCGADTGCLTYTSIGERAGEDALGAFFEVVEWTRTQAGTSVVFASRSYGDGTQVFKQSSRWTQRHQHGRQGPRQHRLPPRGLPLRPRPPLRDSWRLHGRLDAVVPRQHAVGPGSIPRRRGRRGGRAVPPDGEQPDGERGHVGPLERHGRERESGPWGFEAELGGAGARRGTTPGFSLEVVLHPHSRSVVRNICLGERR
nr:uncharacterized protein LOC113828982 [Penaeus vannamei]